MEPAQTTNLGTRLHLGCGLNTPEGWINLDGSWNARLARHPNLRRLLTASRLLPASLMDVAWSPNILIHDLRKPLPFESSSVSAIYASHVLEHLYFKEATELLKECLRTLQPGGVLRLVVPDFQAIVAEYQGAKPFGETSSEWQAVSPADRANRRLLQRRAERPSGNILFRVYTALGDFHAHKWAYDAESLTGHYQSAGFVNVQERQFRQSNIPGIEAIEESRRVEDGAGICVEGFKAS